MASQVMSWPGGEHKFSLPLGQLRALQEKRGMGPEEIFNHLRLGTWRIDDVLHVLRLGLIGGGMSEQDASKLVVPLFDLHPLLELKIPALAVLAQALLGDVDDALGKPEAEGAPQESGSSPKSTE